MTLREFTVAYAARLYNALLYFYPYRFRVRFGPEMAQVFRDCCNDALEKGDVGALMAFWLRTAADVFCSLMRESRSDVLRPMDSEHPLVGLVDLVLIPSMVAGNLTVLGPALTLIFQGRAIVSANQFVVTSVFFSLSIAVLTILASLVITKLRPTVRLWVKLS